MTAVVYGQFEIIILDTLKALDNMKHKVCLSVRVCVCVCVCVYLWFNVCEYVLCLCCGNFLLQ